MPVASISLLSEHETYFFFEDFFADFFAAFFFAGMEITSSWPRVRQIVRHTHTPSVNGPSV